MLYVELYFHRYEPLVVAYAKGQVVWDILLANNRVDLVKLWIDLDFGDSADMLLDSDKDRSDIRLLLSNLRTTDAMTDVVEASSGMPLFNNFILNYLCRYLYFAS